MNDVRTEQLTEVRKAQLTETKRFNDYDDINKVWHRALAYGIDCRKLLAECLQGYISYEEFQEKLKGALYIHEFYIYGLEPETGIKLDYSLNGVELFD